MAGGPWEVWPKTRIPLAAHKAATPSRTILWSSASTTLAFSCSCIPLLCLNNGSCYSFGSCVTRDYQFSAGRTTFNIKFSADSFHLLPDRPDPDARSHARRPGAETIHVKSDPVIGHRKNHLIVYHLERSLDLSSPGM